MLPGRCLCKWTPARRRRSPDFRPAAAPCRPSRNALVPSPIPSAKSRRQNPGESRRVH